MKKALIAVLVIGVVVGIAMSLKNDEPSEVVVTTYGGCVAAGYPTADGVCTTPEGQSFTAPLAADISDLIIVDAPQEFDSIKSPFTIRGEARGPWFFEASFPVELVDADGIRLSVGVMQATEDWMTEEFVPFKGVITFNTPTTEDGTLILRNDNPSGLEENAREIRVPVKFDPVAPRPVKLSVASSLAIGDRVRYEDGLVVVLKEIDDSRCAPDVQCVWQGELSALFLVGDRKDEIRLGTVNNKSGVHLGHTFTLRGATETTATLLVTKNP